MFTFTSTASAVNQINFTNSAIGNPPILSSAGGDTNIGMKIDGKGIGNLLLQTTNAGNVGIGTTSPNYKLELSTDSAAKSTTNTWNIVSDKRIKKNITDFEDGLDVVMKLIPRTYQYNGLGGAGL